MFKEIYGKKNVGKSNYECLAHIVEELGELAEDMRKQHLEPRRNKKGELEGILVNVPDVFAWLCAFASRFGSLEEMVWRKYPNICGYCFYDKNCICLSQTEYMDEEERQKTLESYRKNKTGYPKTLYEWQMMLRRIYGNVNRIQSFSSVGFHLMEEGGEVANEILRGNVDKLKDELADVFAWLIGVCIRYEPVLDKEIRIDDIIWARYPNECPHCHSNPCDENCKTSSSTGPPRHDVS
jgi:NTP pyrophosphatase (non-canonical NTP hydrolase)